MALRDMIAGETNDARTAATNAALGRSTTGFSGRHTEMPEPLAGRFVEAPRVTRIGGDEAAQQQQFADQPPLPRRPAAQEGERVPFEDAELKMAWPSRPGYRRYWFNDVPGRIMRAKRAGYTHVIDSDTGGNAEVISDKTVQGGRKSYLMELPMPLYQQDMARNASRVQASLDQIRSGQAGPGSGDNRYIPSTGISITHGVGGRR